MNTVNKHKSPVVVIHLQYIVFVSYPLSKCNENYS